MSNDALILDLAAGLTPVRRRSPVREALLLLALGATELALILMAGAMRHDMGMMMGSAYMLWRIGSLAILAVVGGVVAIRSFSPIASPRRGMALLVGLSGLAMIAGAFVAPATTRAQPLFDRLAPTNGMVCAIAVIVLALPIMIAMALFMRRAAPTHPEGSALATGLASGIIGALIFAFCCPMNDPLYIVVWYSAGCAVVTATARWLLPKRFRL